MVSSIISKCFNLFFLILCSGEILDFVVYSLPIQQDCVLPMAQTKNIYLGPQAPILSSLPFTLTSSSLAISTRAEKKSEERVLCSYHNKIAG